MERFEEAYVVYFGVIKQSKEEPGIQYEATLASKISYGLTRLYMGKLFKGLKLFY